MPITGSDKVLMFAQVGVVRVGAKRVGSHSGLLAISLAGIQIAFGKTDSTVRVLNDSVTVTDILDETPNTCQFTVTGIVPTKGQEVILTLGSTSNMRRLFAGDILQVEQMQQRRYCRGRVGANTNDRPLDPKDRLNELDSGHG